MAHGGKRKGAGRKAGRAELPKIHSYFTPKELANFVENLKGRAKESDKIAVFLAEQVWGKAHQTVGTEDGRPLMVAFDNSFKDVAA